MASKPDPQSFLPLSEAVFEILLALADGSRHGYAIMQEVALRTDGRVTIGPGTLYGAIKRLRSDGLVEPAEATEAGTDERRRHYRLTDLGRSVAVCETQRMTSLVRTASAKRLVALEGLG